MTQRIYLVGAGIIARTHAAAIKGLSATEPIQLSVADPNAATLSAFANQFPAARTFTDAASMLAEDAAEDDIVVVATPPSTHHELACAALESGRHVLCEKPLAMDRAEARAMFALALQRQRLLGCCSVRYFGWSPFEETRRLLKEEILGSIYHVRFTFLEQRNRPGIEYQPETLWFLDRAKSGGGTLMDRAPYEFSLLNSLFQPVRVDVLNAWLADPLTALSLPQTAINDVEQHAGATLRYYLQDGTTFIMHYERASGTHSTEQADIEITGLKGAVRWDWPHRRARKTLSHTYDHAGQAETKTITFPAYYQGPVPFLDKPLHYFYQRVHGQDSPAVVNEQALFNFSCVRAIYDCASTQQVQTIVAGE
ncbi:Gfo/Idh/MocA family protein [Dictyobacter formicarum]|uniref:Myo-inositol 2-dehydrogenase n=1 Tax=Dictyobacter formicarum TaxID=2778368 RepID=A0ABQ3VMH4_9CHLR|nr:Gfo/Idh/MocA family oxidoreductase [Dictyobacter formicarum]GHO87417.1 myo-inositol 2-dehydrogenase [Dictyobacter formicarum]